MALDQSQLNESGVQSIRGAGDAGDDKFLIQTFTVGLPEVLSKIVLKLYKDGSTTDDLVVKLTTADDSALSGNTNIYPGTVLATKIIPNASLPTSFAEVDIVFDTSPTLNVGQQYSIWIGASGTHTGWSFYIRDAISAGYADGEEWRYVSGTWTSYSAYDLYFKTYMTQNTIWEDVNTDIRWKQEATYNINCDIRAYDEIPITKSINADIRASERLFYNINCDIRTANEYLALYDINSDIRASLLTFNDINCDIRVVQGSSTDADTDIDCDIRALMGSLSDINCDIRTKPPIEIYNINCDIRVMQPPVGGTTEIPIAGQDTIRVKIAGTFLDDISRDTVRAVKTSDSKPGTASFEITRYSDDYNRTLEASSSPLSSDSIIEIYFGGTTDADRIWYGFIEGLDTALENEKVLITGYDRKWQLKKDMQDIEYGRDTDYVTTGSALTKILNEAVSNGRITGYDGVPTGITVEPRQQEGVPIGDLIDELLDMTGNFKWDIDVSGVLHIWRSGYRPIKTLSLNSESEIINPYNVIDYDFIINDKKTLITKYNVILGTESLSTYNSFKAVTLNRKQMDKSWIGSSETQFVNQFIENTNLMQTQSFSGQMDTTGGTAKPAFRNFGIPFWTEGSYFDNTVPIIIETPAIVQQVLTYQQLLHKYKVVNHDFFDYWVVSGYNFDTKNGIVILNRSTFIPTRLNYTIQDVIYIVLQSITDYTYLKPVISCRYYQKKTIILETNPTIFDVTWVGNNGAGETRRLNLSNLSIRESVSWREFDKNGILKVREELGFDDTEYATDRANLMLSRVNDAVTEGSIELTLDAWKYYDINIADRVNIDNTNYADIYNGNNGFPLDVDSIIFNAGSYTVQLGLSNARSFVATKDWR